MALKVWLPLNGTLDNLGTSNYSITAFRGSITYNANGKIGQCFHSNGVNTLKINNILPDIYNYSAYSLCAWAYVESNNTSHSGSGIISAGNWNNQLLNLSMSDWSTDHYTKLRISGTNWNRTYSYNFYKNIWYHIVVCDDGTHTYAYVNGALIGDTAASFLPTSIEGTDICIGGATYYAGMQFFGRINDVRIYDHCLSAAEVHELSQGLILHYKLDTIRPNYILNSSGVFLTNLGSADGSRLEYRAKSLGQNLPIASGTTITISFDLHMEFKTANPYLYVYNTNNKGPHQTINGINALAGRTVQVGDIIHERISVTGTITDRDSPTQTTDFIEFYSNYGSNNWFSISNIKLEVGSGATAYVPAEMNLPTTIEDSSGYNRNGSITGTLTADLSTPRYSSSTYFNGSSYILTAASSFAWNDLTQLTFSAWMKPTASMTGWRGSVGVAADTTQTARGIAITDYGNEFRGTYTNGSAYATVTTGKTLTQNEWHHCAGTLNGTEFKLYFDGALVKTETINWGTASLNANARFEVGVDIPGTDEKFTGNYSDVRMYCTPLSADDIKQLYELGAKVDNKGNLHTFELNEYSINKLTKTGILKDNIIEPYITLSDGSHWKLLLFHWVDHGNNLFTSTNASYCNDFGLYSRLNEADNYTYNSKYEFYVLQDDIEYRWTQTNKPTAASPSGFTAVSGYTNAVQGLVKPTSLTQTYFGYNSWWGACGSWTKYSTGGKTGIPGFGSHSAAGMCENYLALYARIDDATFRLAHLSAYANNFIEL